MPLPLSSQCQSPPCFLNPSNQALENAIQFLFSLDILPPISRTLPLYSKMNSEKRVSSPFLSTYNNEIPFSELSGWYPLPDQFMNIGLDRVSATLPPSLLELHTECANCASMMAWYIFCSKYQSTLIPLKRFDLLWTYFSGLWKENPWLLSIEGQNGTSLMEIICDWYFVTFPANDF